MRAALPLVVVLWAATAAAFRGRPVGDLRFEDRSLCDVEALASDGTAALAVCVDRNDAGEIYGQILRGDGDADPIFLIARGRGSVAASWNGSAYVVAVASVDGLSVATVSRGGAMSPMRTLRKENFTDAGLASNGSRTLLAASFGTEVAGYLLDANADAIAAIPLGGIMDWDVAPLGSGFAFAQFGPSLTTIVRISAGGAIAGTTSLPTPVPGTGEQRQTVMTSNGTRALLLFASNGERSIKSATVSADGTVERAPAVIVGDVPRPRIEIRRNAVAWTGRDYLAAIRLQADDTRFQPYAMRIAANGERIGNLDTIADPDHPPRAIAAVGGRVLVACSSTNRQGSTVSAIRSGEVRLDGSLTSLGRRVNAHEAFAIGAMKGQSLAAWVELHDRTATVRAARIDRNGAHRDGAGIVLAQTRALDVAVASDGTNWLVVWTDGRVRGVRLSADGRVLDAAPIDLGEGFEVDLARGTNEYLLIVSTGVAWVSLRVDSAGVAGPRQLIAQGAAGDSRGHGRIELGAVQVAFDGTNFLSVATEVHTTCDEVEPVCAKTSYLSAARFDRLGAMLEQPLHRFTLVSGPADVAGGGGSFLLLMNQYTRSDFHVTAMMMDGWLPPVATPRLLLGPGHSVSVTWDGREFVAAWIGASWRVETARLTEMGVVDGPRTMTGGGGDATRPQLVADSATPALLAYLNPQPGTDDVPRVATTFAREVDVLPPVPLPPAISTATRVGSDVRVRWAPVANAFGIDVELLLEGGGWRRIATAPGTAAEVVAPMVLRGYAIRLRAWSPRGTSAPSAEAWIAGGRVRAIRR